MCLLISSRARGTLGRGPVPRSRNDVNRTPSTPPPSSLVVILTSTGSRLVTLERLRAVVPARIIPRCTASGGVQVGEDSVFVPCSAPPLPANCVVSERPLWEVAAPVYSEKRRNLKRHSPQFQTVAGKRIQNTNATKGPHESIPVYNTATA